LETSVLFAQEGAFVVCADLNQEAGEALVTSLNAAFSSKAAPNDKKPRCIFKKTDVSKEDQVKALVELAVSTFGRLDIMFNNAGIMHPADDNAETTPENVWDMTMNVNVKGVWFGCKYAIPQMRKNNGGSIINTASFVALLGAATPQLACIFIIISLIISRYCF
jgi:NAD(P)-dependent dehydrogenase (short-subunit alcohol dehydrogenase family)